RPRHRCARQGVLVMTEQRLAEFLHAETPVPPTELDPVAVRTRGRTAHAPHAARRRYALVATSVLAVLVLALGLVLRLSTGPTTTHPGAPLVLTPSIPAFWRNGLQYCGDPYAVNVTTTQGTKPLADCPGLVGGQLAPTVTVRVGAPLLIS